jgi:hypothetical protein
LEYHERNTGKLMYYQAGEYGSQTHRPHYHAIVYDLPIKPEELKIYKQKNGFRYYNVEWLTKLCTPYGCFILFSSVGPNNPS